MYLLHLHMCTATYTYAHMYACMCVCVCMCVYVCVCVHVYIYAPGMPDESRLELLLAQREIKYSQADVSFFSRTSLPCLICVSISQNQGQMRFYLYIYIYIYGCIVSCFVLGLVLAFYVSVLSVFECLCLC